MCFEPFQIALVKNGIELTRKRTVTLQINTGPVCNQSCRHCHLEAGPHRREAMDRRTMDAVIAYAARGRFEAADVTGGAPELNPDIRRLLEGLHLSVARVILRTNLTALNTPDGKSIAEFCKKLGTVITASFPSMSASQSEAQRGEGNFQTSIAVLRYLNGLGYGAPGSGLILNLVSNPGGAFLPPSQDETENRFRKDLQSRWGVVFDDLFALANAPLGRFRKWLIESGNFEPYMARLAASFNPCTVDGLMCRTLVSVSWDGHLYDCDFNLAAGLPMSGGARLHVSEMDAAPPEGLRIAVSDHCYACAAGPGFT